MLFAECFYCAMPALSEYVIPGQAGICQSCNKLEIAANFALQRAFVTDPILSSAPTSSSLYKNRLKIVRAATLLEQGLSRSKADVILHRQQSTLEH